MKRGSLVTVALPGDFGKPRPALVIQSDLFDTETLSVLLVFSTLKDAPDLRIPIAPNDRNGLWHPSQVAIDKIMTVRREKVGQTIGTLDNDVMTVVTRNLAVFMGFG